MNKPRLEALYNDPALARFYDLSNGWNTDFDFCVHLAADSDSVLDLGCGTGQLAAALARDHTVTGVDPAAAMLDVARGRPGGGRVTWVEDDARSVRLGRRFDLIVLTGHAFQVFLTDADQEAVAATISAHLTPGGRFIFDSRNPLVRTWEDRGRTETVQTLEHPELGAIEKRTESFFDEASTVLTYRDRFIVEATGEEHSSSAQIRYTPKDQLAATFASAGLRIDQWLGDWHGNPYTPEARDIIPLGGST